MQPFKSRVSLIMQVPVAFMSWRQTIFRLLRAGGEFELDLFKSYKDQRPQTLEGFVNRPAPRGTSIFFYRSAAGLRAW